MTIKEHIKAMKKFLDDPTASDSLKLSILGWMWDNRFKINGNPDEQDDKFQQEVEIFGTLTNQTKS